jgi:uncharacterized protein YcbK (DUF882 family)
MSKWRYFTEAEVQGLDQETVAMLDMARHHAGVPFVITSGLRAKDSNATVGGVQDSAHLFGKAVDLRSQDSATHFAIVKGAILAGFNRIGIYRDKNGKPSHIHLDNATDLPQCVMWMGISK